MAFGMNYFRRPALAGKNLPRTPYAIIRGSVRRSDPDGISTVPYFPDVSAGDDLEIRVQSTTYLVTFTANSLQTIISEINTALGVAGSAFDSDGCLGLQSNTLGGSSIVAILGGTAAEALGFDLTLNEAIGAWGGEVPSAPEGRVSNWYGSMFAGRGEDLTTESVNRSLAMLASNMDVIYSELARSQAKVQLIGQVSPVADVETLDVSTVNPSVRTYTGLGLLSGSSSKQSLSPYFFFVDTATGLLAPSRVTAVVKGTPASYPRPGLGYTDTAGWGANDGGNVLGLNLAKVTGAAITEVREGRLAKVGTNLTTNGVTAGDIAEISGATNLTPFDHNGTRWIVEEVRDDFSVLLRPMSRSEMDMVGYSSNDLQPILELNERKTGAEVYGNLTIKTGSFMNDVTLVLEPPLPSGSTYDVYAASATDFRTEGDFVPRVAIDEDRFHQIGNLLAADYDSVPSAIISGLTASAAGADVNVTAGIVRWRGKAHSIPAKTFVAPAVPSYIFFDEADGALKNDNSFGNEFNPADSTRGILVASITASGVFPAVRTAGADGGRRHVTVGRSADFTTLEAAVEFINAYTLAHDVSAPSGYLPHWEIVLNGPVTVTSDITIMAYGLMIRGSNPDVTVTLNGSSKFVHQVPDAGVVSSVTFEDFKIAPQSNVANRPFLQINSGVNVNITNVKHSGSQPFSVIVQQNGAGSIDHLTVLDSYFILARGISWSAVTSEVRVVRSRFLYTSDTVYTTPVLFGPSAGTGAWDGRVYAERCLFLNWVTTATSSDPMFARISTASELASVVSNCLFTFGAFAANSSAALMSCDNGRLLVVDNVCELIPLFMTGSASAHTVVSGNRIRVKPNGAAQKAVVCMKALNNYISVTAPDTVGNNGIVLEILDSAIGNSINGPALTGISMLNTANAVCANNVIDTSTTPTTIASTGIKVLGFKPAVTGNVIKITGSASSAGISAGGSHCSISGNSIESAALGASSMIVTSSGNGTISGNSMSGTGATSGINIQGGTWSVTGNYNCNFICSGTSNVEVVGNQFSLVTLTGGANTITFTGNTVSSDLGSGGSGTGTYVISSNIVSGNLDVPNLPGAVISNNVAGSMEAPASGVVLGNHVQSLMMVAVVGTLQVANNVIEDTIYLTDAAGGEILVTGNYIGVIDATSMSGAGKAFIEGNQVIANVTLSNVNSFSNNYTIGTVTITGVSGNTRVDGNTMDGVLTHSFTDCNVTNNIVANTIQVDRCVVSGNKAANIAAAHSVISGNEVTGSISARTDMSPATNILVISANKAASIQVAQASSVQLATITGNYASNIQLNRSGAVSGNTVNSITTNNSGSFIIEISGNLASQSFDAMMTGASGTLYIKGNYLDTLSQSQIYASKVYVAGNHFDGSVSFGDDIIDSEFYVDGNTINSSAEFLGKIFVVTGNVFNSTALFSASDTGTVEKIKLSGNTWYSTSGWAIKFGSRLDVLSSTYKEVMIEGNTVQVHDIFGVGGGHTYNHPIRVDSSVAGMDFLKISGNTIRRTTTGTPSVAFPLNATQNMPLIFVEISVGRVVITDNMIEKPANVTDGTRTWTYQIADVVAPPASKGMLWMGNYITRNSDGTFGTSVSTYGGVQFQDIYKGQRAFALNTALVLSGD